MTHGRGPFVAIAVLCQGVERRDDGTLDLHGIVEGVALEPAPPSDDDPLGLRPAAVLSFRLVVSLRAGDVRGQRRVDVVGRYPAGNAGPSTGRDVEFSEHLPTATLNVPLELEVHEPGTYVFDVLVDGTVVTRVPLVVVFQEGIGSQDSGGRG